jgi:hypothetical protein
MNAEEILLELALLEHNMDIFQKRREMIPNEWILKHNKLLNNYNQAIEQQTKQNKPKE